MKRILFILPLAFGLIVLANAAATTTTTPANAANQGATGANNKNPLIEKACISAPHKVSCIQTLQAQPNSANADIKTLAFMSLNVTKTYGKNVSDWVAQRLEAPELGPEIEQALTDCSDQYTDAMAQVEDTLVAFFSNALQDVKTWMSTALTNAQTCEEGLKGANAADAMGDRNQVFSQYCSNSLAIINELAKQKL